MSEISAYEEMLRSGKAFERIDMNKIQNQLYAGAGGAVEEPLGEPVKESKNENENTGLEEEDIDWSDVDAGMQRRMNALREKMKGGGASTKEKPIQESKEIYKLKKRVAKLEEAMIIIMESQEQIIEGKYK